ncbi:uncharacterized protein G2W53_004238 [Senna tora]|uniref:Uncharacterized protein n=1 Tax=Senna tora TaxID=362788 RepID=A0A834XCD8_9FABA|nr:uncharacterized protein G2W53_004238 [Senna tora]
MAKAALFSVLYRGSFSVKLKIEASKSRGFKASFSASPF